MKPSSIAATLALALAACAANPAPAPAPPAPPPPPPTLADELDAMCACTAPACTDQVHARFAAAEATRDASEHARVLREGVKACDGKARTAEEVSTMSAMRDDMCACHDALCVDAVNKKYMPFMKQEEDKYRGGAWKPSAAVMHVGEALATCMADAMQGPSTPTSSSSGGGVGVDRSARGASASVSTGVPDCDTYIATMDRYMSCDKIPQQAKDASRQSIEAMKQSWAELRDPSVPASVKKAAAEGCHEAVEALHQSAEAMGCPL